MTLLWVTGFTAIDVSLSGTLCSQSVLTFAALDVVVVQMGVPILGRALLPNTAVVTGAGASTPLWVKSIGWARSPSSPASAGPAARNETARNAEATRASGPVRRRRDGDIRFLSRSDRRPICAGLRSIAI